MQTIKKYRPIAWQCFDKIRYNITPKLMKRPRFKLDVERCITGKFYQPSEM
jgi:hypothetical protein